MSLHNMIYLFFSIDIHVHIINHMTPLRLDIYAFSNVYHYRLLRLWINKRHIKPKKTEILPDNNFIFTNAEYEVVENNADYQELEDIFQSSL